MRPCCLLFRHKTTTDHSKHSVTFTKVAARGVLWDGPYLSTSFRKQRILVSLLSAGDTANRTVLRSSVQEIWYSDPLTFTGTFLQKSPSSVAWLLLIRWVMLQYMFGSVKMQVVYLPLAYQVVLVSLYQRAFPFIIHKSDLHSVPI